LGQISGYAVMAAMCPAMPIRAERRIDRFIFDRDANIVNQNHPRAQARRPNRCAEIKIFIERAKSPIV
jgi:hypothetical protein